MSTDSRTREHPPAPAPDPHPWLTPVLPFLGVWTGTGEGHYPTLDEGFAFEQEMTFEHDGRPFLHYEARAWLVDPDGGRRPSGRENGWIRVGPDGYTEALIGQPTGIAEIHTGRVAGGVLRLTSTQVMGTPLAKEVTEARREYAIDPDGRLRHTTDLAAVGHPLTRHLTTTLHHPQTPPP
ncbi:FABP family protein (plasmid) [Streptomyces sp. BI20]|uniref:FABP family protein n=1 Tax=Streptomyces sp. BI20 TaxID=3403460 RepID=UPI003C7761A1